MEQTNYEKCWKDLRQEMEYLAKQGVKSLDPNVVLSLMGYIEQLVTLREELRERSF